MKRCSACNLVYEDRFNQCPTCGGELRPYRTDNTTTSHQQRNDTSQQGGQGYYSNDGGFEVINGNTRIINGVLVETNTQQYYQSRSTKLIRALFSGEPYQLSHTSFNTQIRVEEHAVGRIPELSRDVLVYGSVQNVLATGDDLEIVAEQRGNRLIARRIYNHSIDQEINVQAGISAGVVRGLAIAAVIVLFLLVRGIVTFDYANLGNSIASLILSMMPTFVVIGIIWYLYKSFRKK